MIQYILECIAFQLVFLVIYDFWLKRETFFQWNRFYLIFTYILTLVLPWVKIEAFGTIFPEQYYFYPDFLWEMNSTVVKPFIKDSNRIDLPTEYVILYGGMFLATVLFSYKIFQIYRLRKKGVVRYFPNFTRIIVTNSHIAFSFFRSIFLGDRVLEKEYDNIIRHELVHIRQKHSLDLLFFELMRIACWFNPLVYVYQNRISELHEFIADAQVVKTQKKAQYQLLLSQVFQTSHISFINHFFKTSLIKKRIVMLQKSKSKKIWKLKYLVMVPLVVGMLCYTSCQNQGKEETMVTMAVEDIENLTAKKESEIFGKLASLSEGPGDWELHVEDGNSSLKFVKSGDGSYISGPNNERINAKMAIESSLSKFPFNKTGDITFDIIDEVPVFPGCNDVEGRKACFMEKIELHIKKNFNYPEEARSAGIQGIVSVLFTIAEDGNIQNIKLRGPHTLLEQEAERIVKRLPQMKPGRHRGKVVKVPFSIPITFKLQ